jgi:hypothetical protein
MKRAPVPAAVHSSIGWPPSELQKANTGRRPMKRLMPTGLPGQCGEARSFTALNLLSAGRP